jgi:hypothetical protein
MFTIDQLRSMAREAESELSPEVHKFVDWIERKFAPPEITVAERERLAAEARAPAGDAAPSLESGAAKADSAPAGDTGAAGDAAGSTASGQAQADASQSSGDASSAS